MIAPACPYCGSKNIEETGLFDMTYIEPDECGHDFECSDCGGLFQILYAPFEVRKVAGAKPGEVESAKEMVRSRTGQEDVAIDFNPQLSSPVWNAFLYFTRYTGRKRITAHRDSVTAEGDTPTEAAEKLVAEYEAFRTTAARS